jgi:S1-C subfamily serine protease
MRLRRAVYYQPLARGIALTLLLASSATPAPPQLRSIDPQNAVLQVSAQWRVPNPMRPWARTPTEVSGSGVVIDGQRILTNAHLVLFATEVFVQDRAGGDRLSAKVKGIGPDVDLAVLELEDPTFFENHPALPRVEKLPDPQSPVTVYGFPIGGNGLSVTQGIISRIDYNECLMLQVDAAINPGNSGGPALVNNQMVGLVFARMNDAENVGYIITNREIDAFLADIRDGEYRGKVDLEIYGQTLENPALRDKLGIDRSVRGILVRRSSRPGKTSVLQPFDVLTHVGGVQIDNEGMVQQDGGPRLPFSAIVDESVRENCLPITIVRAGQTIEVELPVEFDEVNLIPSYDGKQPPWFACGPLVFAPARIEAINTYFRARPVLNLMGSPLLKRSEDRPDFEGQELVVVTAPMAQHPITRGYDQSFGQVVKSVNGVEIKNLTHLVETIRDADGDHLVFEFAEPLAETLVFKRQEFIDATEEIMADNGIPRRGSEDMVAIWERTHTVPSAAEK